MDVRQDDAGDLNERDDEGSFGQCAQVIANGANAGTEDWSCWQLGLVPEVKSQKRRYC